MLVPAATAPSLADPGRVVIGLAHEDRVQLVGAWDAERGWMPADSIIAEFRAGATFTLYGLNGRLHEATLGNVEFEEVVADWWGTLDRPLPAGRFAVALLGSGHNPVPRLPRSQSLTISTYRQAGAAALAPRGIRTSAARLAQSFRIDLDGNGTDEVLMTLRSRNGIGAHPDARRGDYAGVLLRHIPATASPAPRGLPPSNPPPTSPTCTALILNAWPRGSEFSAPEECELLACVDIDGDGKLESIVRTWYYEGDAVTVFSFDGRRVVESLCYGWGL